MVLASVDISPCPAAAAPAALTAAERARQRELASYFSAVSLSPKDQAATAQPVPPTISRDAALNALTQLGALRLNCDRAFLSLMDGRCQYIIAEATRSHSLRQANHCASGDAIFLGRQSLDLSFGVCPDTMKVFTDVTGETVIDSPNVYADRTRYIIRDFLSDPMYRDRPYVKDWPYMRSYLEVPLICARGYVIGTYCVVDNKLRTDFEDEQSIFVLTEVASTIMDHLDLMRTNQNHSRTERRMKGLGVFMEGNSSIQNWLLQSASTDTSSESSRRNSPQNTGEAAEIGSESSHGPIRNSGNLVKLHQHASDSSDSSAGSSLDGAASPVFPASAHTTPATDTDSNSNPFDVAQPPRNARSNTGFSTGEMSSRAGAEARSLRESVVPVGVKTAFSRASNLIRESMDVDGVVFLDACPSGFSSRVNSAPSTTLEPENPFDAMSEGQFDMESQSMCGRLGFATRMKQSLSNDELNEDILNLPEALLQRMIFAFPRGQVFGADEFGPLSHWDDERRASISSQLKQSPNGSSQRRADIDKMFQMFGEARSIMFLPLWDFQKDRFFAATLVFSNDPERMFQPSDVTYLSAFGNSVMAEVARFDALATSHAKSDFISSVSHELRSPLHGILASAELLREMLSGHPHNQHHDMLDIIVSCSSTLLDTMNQLLDFAKINSLAKPNIARASISSPGVAVQQRQDPVISSSYNDLSLLVQDVTESVYLGHYSQKSFHTELATQGWTTTGVQAPVPNNNERPLVIVKIDKCPDRPVELNAGSWKRIVMNLLGNALKYTPSGCIEIRLRITDYPDQSHTVQDAICFEIIDTGIGMSAEYLKYRLFTPFAQENTLSVGTGLGLSIVHQITQSLGGRLEVQSELGVGTHIKVMVPIGPKVDKLYQHKTTPTEPNWVDAKKKLEGLKLCFVAMEPDPEGVDVPPETLSVEAKRALALKDSLSQIASNWLGMTVSSASRVGAIEADIYVAEESFVDTLAAESPSFLSESSHSGPLAPLVVLSGEITPARFAKVGGRVVTYLRHPIGPKKLSTILLTALESTKEPDSANEQWPVNSPLANTNPPDRPLHLRIPSRPGTTPTMLPMRSPRPVVLQELKSAEKPTPSTSSKQHLLLVDDNAINLKILTTHIRKLGHTYATAINGFEAVRVFQASAQPFDVVFMDVSMPVMDGFTATREIRAYEKLMGMLPCKVVALTGLGSVESQQEAFASGVDLFLTKPVPLKSLKELLLKYENVAQQVNTKGDGDTLKIKEEGLGVQMDPPSEKEYASKDDERAQARKEDAQDGVDDGSRVQENTPKWISGVLSPG